MTAKVDKSGNGSICRSGRKSSWQRPRRAWAPALLFLGLGLAVFPAAPAQAAIAFDAVTSFGSPGCDPCEWTHTVTTGGSDRILVVAATAETKTNQYILDVTYNGLSLTEIRQDLLTNNLRTSLWYLVNPPTGAAHTVSVNYSHPVDKFVGASLSFTGVDQIDPIDDASNGGFGATGTSTTATVNVTTVNADAWIVDAMVVKETPTMVAKSGRVERWNVTAGGPIEGAGSTLDTTGQGIGSYTMDWTFASDAIWAISAAALKPPATSIAKAFAPDSILSGGTSTITFTLGNPGGGALTGASFTDAYPAGMTNTGPLVTGGTCANVVTTAVAGGSSFDVTAGDIPAAGSCTITVDVTTTATGTNTTSVLSTNELPDSITGSSATLTINTAPVANEDKPKTHVDTPAIIAVLANDTDAESDPLTITLVDSPTTQGGTATINDNGTPGDSTDDYIDYTPPLGFYGVDTFTYTIEDDFGFADTGTVTVSVMYVDFKITKIVTFAVGDDSASTQMDTATTIDVLANDFHSAHPDVGENVGFRVTLLNEDDEKPDLDLVVTDLLPAGLTFVSATVSTGSYNSTNGEWSLKGPKQGKTETLDIVATADVSTPVTNIAEITSADTFDPDSTPNNGDPAEDDQDSVIIEADGTAVLTITLVDSPTTQGGTASINDNGTPGDPSDDFIDYTPPAGFTGTDTFTYTIDDGFGNTDTATVTVTITYTPALIKTAFETDGTPIPTGSIIPSPVVFKYLLYINNKAGVTSDVSVRDVLDAAFQFQAGTIQVDNSVAECALAVCTAAEELSIFTAVDGAGFLTDAIDGDVASITGSTIDAGNQNVANLQLDINANDVWAIMFSVKMP